MPDAEKDLLVLAGGPNTRGQVMTYPKLVLANHRVILAKSRSRATKRNNSCVYYKSEGRPHYGIVEKIIVFKELAVVKCFLLLKYLEPAPLLLCNDTVTHANIQKHYSAFHPPKLVRAVCVCNCHTFVLFIRPQNQAVISATDVLDKCVFLDSAKYTDYVFVSHFPNLVEVE